MKIEGNEGVMATARIEQARAEVKEIIVGRLEEADAEEMIAILADLMHIKEVNRDKELPVFVQLLMGMGVLEFESIMAEWLASKQVKQ